MSIPGAFAVDTPEQDFGYLMTNLFTKSNEVWWQQLKISEVKTLQIRHYRMSIAHVNLLLKETETAIAHSLIAWASQRGLVVS